MVLTANIGPAKDKDLASPDPDIRKAGVNYLIDILKAMEKVGSKSLCWKQCILIGRVNLK